MGDLPNNRPAPTASGTLAKTPFVHLLLYVLHKRLGGTLELLGPDERTAVVLFSQGEPLKARTSESVAHLGTVLLELGFVDQGQLDRSLVELAKQKAAAAGQLHGALLVSSGAIDAAKLRAGLVEQLGRKLRHVAAMPADTKFAYFDGFDALRGWGGADSPPVDPMQHLWHMLREYAPWEHVNAALARIAGSPLRLSPTADPGRLRLAGEEADAVELLRARPVRASELAKAASLNERTAQLLTYLLLVTKQVDVVTSSDAAPAGGRSSFVPPISAPPDPPQRASMPAPAKSILPPPPGLAPELAERWKEITARAATIDRADYFMMLDLARDASRDDVESAFFALAKRWHPDRLPAELAPVRDACSRVFARMSEARTTLADDEQRARYMKLLAEGSGSPETQETVAKVVEAAQNFQKAEVFFKRNDLAQAEAFCRQALGADPTQPDYVALLAWLTALKPENQSPEKTLASIKTLDKAIAMNGRCEKALYWRGMLHKRIGKIELASKDFKRVVEINPRNIDAAREVRLHQMRGRRGSAPPPAPARSGGADDGQKGGLFGRLFKK
jgi:tetratricopeptide (TPR) repeat protein